MNNKIKILIAGGDMRQIFCAEKLSQKYDICVVGFDDEYMMDEILLYKNNNWTEKYDCAILPIMPFDEAGNINTPCFSGKLTTAKIYSMLKKNAVVFVGIDDKRVWEKFPETAVVNYMSREELCLKNAIPTAEGAIMTAIRELPVTLNGTSVLIVGAGRIGTALVTILKGFGADITLAVRNGKGVAKARILGVKSVFTKEMGSEYALVFNTVPELIFDRERLFGFDKNTLFIDLASRPGGINFDGAAELGRKVIWAQGLPGKTAPVTAGEFVAETVIGILDERSESCE